MAYARNIHHGPPWWLQMWHSFELTAGSVGTLLLLILIAAFAIYAR